MKICFFSIRNPNSGTYTYQHIRVGCLSSRKIWWMDYVFVDCHDVIVIVLEVFAK